MRISDWSSDVCSSDLIAHHEKTLGQLFCDGSAKQVVAMLLEECAKGNVDVRCGQPVREVTHADGAFGVTFGDQNFTAPNLVIATGGPSIPKMGATGDRKSTRLNSSH